jgi:thymidylate kinase
LARAEPERFAVVDASQEIDIVRTAVATVINELLDKTIG